jgi:hypothetical protein
MGNKAKTSAKVNTATANNNKKTVPANVQGKGKTPAKPAELPAPPAEIKLDIPVTPAKPAREAVVALAKELNTIADTKIPLKANVATEFIVAQIENSITLLTDSDFVEQEGQVCFTAEAIETFLALGFKIPTTATKTAETITAEKATAKGKAKEKAPKADKYSRKHAFMEVLRGGATKAELNTKAAELYEKHGGKHNATSAEWYATEYLGILVMAGAVDQAKDGKFYLISALTTPATPAK